MDDRTFGAQVVEIPDEIRLRMRGDLDAKADDTLQDAYRDVSARESGRLTLGARRPAAFRREREA